MAIEYRFTKKCVLLGKLWKPGNIVSLPDDYFELKGWKVPPHMELASEPETGLETSPNDVRAWQGSRAPEGETPEERAIRESNDARALASAADSGPPEEDEDDLGL